jgi:hypothetical protein
MAIGMTMGAVNQVIVDIKLSCGGVGGDGNRQDAGELGTKGSMERRPAALHGRQGCGRQAPVAGS